MAHGIPERLHRLPRQGAPRAIRHGKADKQRGQLKLLAQLGNGIQAGLGVERVENRLQLQ